MTFNRLPKNIVKKIHALTEDEEFQKIWGEDKELDELIEQYDIAKDACNTLWDKLDQKKCQLIVDYLFDTKKIDSIIFFSPKIKKWIRDCIIKKMRDPFIETLTSEDDD